mgnify:CR=1 FL=1
MPAAVMRLRLRVRRQKPVSVKARLFLKGSLVGSAVNGYPVYRTLEG